MYNLIVSGREESWDGEPFELERTRIANEREYTDPPIAARFTEFDDAAIRELLSLPTLFAYENGLGKAARIGRVTRIRSRQGLVRFEYTLDPSIPAIPQELLSSLAWELDLGKNELYRTHWAVKPVDLADALLEAEVITRDQAFRLAPRPMVGPSTVSGTRAAELVVKPTVFSVPDATVEVDLVSVMMPFAAGFDPVWKALKGACDELGLRCLRADDVWQDSILIQDVFSLLVRSAVVVVDFTGKNPNVMYETGIAHTLGRPVVPIAQAVDDVPFDLRHHRILKYLPNAEGLAEMKTAVMGRLRTLVARQAS